MILYLQEKLELGSLNLDPSQEEMLINDIDFLKHLKACSVYHDIVDGCLVLIEQKVTLDETLMSELFDWIDSKINWNKYELAYEGGRGGEDFAFKIMKRNNR